MIVTKYFVWIHIPKTGGTWFRGTMKSVMPAEWEPRVLYPGHWSIRELGAEEQARPSFAMIRSPWAWYVSTFFFWRQHYLAHTGGYSQPQDKWTALEQEWAERLEATRDDNDTRWFQEATLAYMQKETLSSVVQAMTNEATRFIRFEQLRNDAIWRLRVTLEEAGRKLPDAVAAALRSRPPEMVSKHGPCEEYYDRMFAKHIERADSYVFERFKYETLSERLEPGPCEF